MSAAQFVVLNDGEVLADVLGKEVYRKRHAQIQKRGMQVASVYHTVFEPAVMVIVEVILTALLAKES